MAYRGSKKHTDYMNGWRSGNLKGYSFFLNPNRDTDIIERLKEVPNKTEYIRQLIRKDIKGSH